MVPCSFISNGAESDSPDIEVDMESTLLVSINIWNTDPPLGTAYVPCSFISNGAESDSPDIELDMKSTLLELLTGMCVCCCLMPRKGKQ